MLDGATCVLCRCLGDDHLLLHCHLATLLWSLVLNWFGIIWVVLVPCNIEGGVVWLGLREEEEKTAVWMLLHQPLCGFFGESNMRASEEVA